MSPTDPTASGRGPAAQGRPVQQGQPAKGGPAGSGAPTGASKQAPAKQSAAKQAPAKQAPARPAPAANGRPATAPTTRPAPAPQGAGATQQMPAVPAGTRPGAPATRPAAQPAARPEAAPARPQPTAKAQASAARPGAPRKVRLNVARLDPWSVLKLSFLLSVGLGVATVVATFVVWQVLNGMGVFTDINGLVRDILGNTTAQSFDLYDYIGRNRVVSLATVIAVANVVLLTALCTLGAFLYNLASGLVGGLHLTLSDD